MIKYFVNEDYVKAEKQAKITLIIYFISLFVMLLISAGLVIWYRTLPYKSPTITVVKIIHYVAAALYVAFSFAYLGIVYKRVNRYRKLCKNLLNGIKETNRASFVEVDLSPHDKDGVDCHALIFLEWNERKQDYFERKVLLLAEKPVPDIPENANVRFVTQGNVLIEYEITD